MSTIYITEPATEGKVCLQTTIGDIDIELWSKECPLACRNFVQLCMEGYYNGCIFHRLVKDFIVQTGDPTGTGHGGESAYGEHFKNERHQRLNFNRRGLVGMAAENKDQNGSQFFFTLGAANELTKKHTLFGKVVGDTVFNVIKLNELQVDQNERPSYLHKITGAKILSNPFPDISPRKKQDDKKSKSDRKKAYESASKLVKKNIGLLSFGDEAEDDDEEITAISKKIKGKSAHDLLEDDLLSKERAVKPHELGEHEEQDEEDEEQKTGRLERIKKKLKAKRRKVDFEDDHEDEDFDKMVDEQKELEKKAELVADELKTLQKAYVKAVRGPKAAEVVDEEASTSEGMKTYKKMHLKFKSGTKGVVKSIDPKREGQTMELLQRFETKLKRATVQGILTDKKVDMSDQRTQEEIILATSEEQGKMDFDAKDVAGEDWMIHEFVAPEDTSGVTKAKDANMKEFNDDWYPIDDPRNPMNIRKREMGGDL